MKEPCIKAYHEMEERYARLVLEYHNNEQRNLICKAVGGMIDSHGIAPAVTVTPTKGLAGEYAIELHDDYDREGGKFFEDLIKILAIDNCEI